MSPDISVILPVYNMERYLGFCLDSILAQSFGSFEILCVDDASTDASLALLRQYAAKDTRIKVYAQDANKGSGPARNRALDLARGEFVVFCDPDDAYPENALDVLHKASFAADADISGGNVMITDETMRYRLASSTPYAMPMWFGSPFVGAPDENPALWFPFYHCRYLFRRRFLETNCLRYPELRRGQDPPFMAAALCATSRVAVLPDVVYHYRQAGSIKLETSRAVQDYLVHIDLVMDTFSRHGKRLQAHLYLALLAASMVTFARLKKLAPELRRELVAFFTERIDRAAAEGFWERNYAPYSFDIPLLRGNIDALRRGYPFFIAHKIRSKVRLAR